jgi:hypothetical protein
MSKTKNVLDFSYRNHLVQKQTSFGPQVLSHAKLRMSWTPAPELTWSRSRIYLVHGSSAVQNQECPGLQIQNSPGPEAGFIWSTGTLMSKTMKVLDSSYRTHLVQKQTSFGPQVLSCPKL